MCTSLSVSISSIHYCADDLNIDVTVDCSTYTRLSLGSVMGLPGFEPGSFPHKAQGIALREPKSPSLDQASRQPLKFLYAE